MYEQSAKQGRHLPVSFVAGSHPIDHVAAVMRTPGDEIKLMASLRGAPMDVIKCVTNDIRVPADLNMCWKAIWIPKDTNIRKGRSANPLATMAA